jgi:NitT/TauT family transport system substrate-binding protein
VIAIGSPYTAQPYVLAGVPDLQDVPGLEGRTLGISSPAGADALLFRYIMGQEGMDHTQDVSFVQIGGSPDRVQALLAGELDAAIIFMDGMVEIEQQTDEIHNVGFMSEFIPEPGWQAALYSGYREFFEENSELALAIACANLETNRWINDNEDEYVQYTLDNVPGATEEAVRDFYAMAMEVDMWPTTADTIVNMPAQDNYIAGMVEGGELDEHIPAEEVIDTSYLEEAEAMGCGAA